MVHQATRRFDYNRDTMVSCALDATNSMAARNE